MTSGQVRVAWPHIERRLEANGYDGVHLLFVVDDGDPRPPEQALTAVRAAVEFANSSYPEREVLAQPGADPSPYGPVVDLDGLGDVPSTRAWLDDLAGHLSQNDWSGTVGPSPDAVLPVREVLQRPGVALFAAYPATVDRSATRSDIADFSGWGATPELTLALCRGLLEWAGLEGGDLYLSQGHSLVEYQPERARVHPGALAVYLSWSLQHSWDAAVYQVGRDPLTVRHADLGLWGECVYQLDADPLLTRLAQVEALRPLLTAQAQHLEIAFVRGVPAWASSWMQVAYGPLRPGGVDEQELRANRHLWSRYAPDAHALQVLTSDHLQRAADLSGWSVTEVTPGRFLVEARDLQPWFAADEPDPDVLAAARRDFGDMLLTPEVIAANPA